VIAHAPLWKKYLSVTAAFALLSVGLVVKNLKTQAAPSSVCIQFNATKTLRSDAQARVILWSGGLDDNVANVKLYEGFEPVNGMKVIMTNPAVLNAIGSLNQIHVYIHVAGYRANRLTLNAPFESCATSSLLFGAFTNAHNVQMSDLLKAVSHIRGQPEPSITAVLSSPLSLADVISAIRTFHAARVDVPVLSVVTSSSSSIVSSSSSKSSSSVSSSSSSQSSSVPSSSASSSSRSSSSVASGTKPFADSQLLSIDCVAQGNMKFHIQFPQGQIPADTPFFIMFHEAGGDVPTSLIWMNTDKPDIIKLRTLMNDKKWVYVVPYYYDRWQGMSDASVISNEICYDAMIARIKEILQSDYGAVANNNPLYIGGASFGGNRSLLLVKRNPSKYAGLLQLYSAIQGIYYNPWPGFDWSQLTVPVFMLVGPGENSIGPAMTRLYHLLQQGTNTTVKYAINSTIPHDPRNFDSAGMVAFFEAGKTKQRTLEQWWPTKKVLDPAVDRLPNDNTSVFFSVEAYQWKYMSNLVEQTVSAKEPLRIAGWPYQDNSGKKRVIAYRPNDSNYQKLSYGAIADGLNTYWDEYPFYYYWRLMTVYFSSRGWVFITPNGFEIDDIISQITTKYPTYTDGNYGLGIGFSGKKVADMALKYPTFYKALVLIEPQIDSAYATTFAATLPLSIPVVLSVRKTDTSASAMATRQLYQLLKDQGRTTMLMEKEIGLETKFRALTMHSGAYEFDYLLSVPAGAYRKVEVAFTTSPSIKYTILEQGNGG